MMIENIDYKEAKEKKLIMVSKFSDAKSTIGLAKTLSGIWNKTAYIVTRSNMYAVFRDKNKD